MVRLGSFDVGDGRCLVVAEAGVNHNGDMELARALVDAAADAGADAIKLQTFRADQVVTARARQAAYQERNTGRSEPQLEMLRRLELGESEHRELIERAGRRGLLLLSTPFDQGSADLLERLGVCAFKVSSGELTNLAFLGDLAARGRPLIVSTGMATLGETEQAVRTIERADAPGLVLLHCVSNYPADPADVNLRAMATLEAAFGVPVGLSDHTEGIVVAIAAAALGAAVIEKHLTLDRGLPGPDHRASLEPDELKAMVDGIRVVESALGTGRKIPAASELEVARAARRSLVAARALAAGTRLERDMLLIRRPGTGLAPAMLEQVLGRRLRTGLGEGDVLLAEHLE